MINKTLVLFDFDGTITYKDSADYFYKFLYNSRLNFIFNNYILCFKLIILFKLKLTDYYALKKRRLEIHTSKYDTDSLLVKSEIFRNSKMQEILIPAALDKIQWHKLQGHDIWLVSASYDFILEKWALDTNINLITNKTIYLNKKRMFCTNDINFEEKLIQIKKVINLNEYNEIYAYGDSDGDKKMLEIATKSFYKYFN
jgi:HAD superfamily hydrolase (TIGR01490 family)